MSLSSLSLHPYPRTSLWTSRITFLSLYVHTPPKTSASVIAMLVNVAGQIACIFIFGPKENEARAWEVFLAIFQLKPAIDSYRGESPSPNADEITCLCTRHHTSANLLPHNAHIYLRVRTPHDTQFSSTHPWKGDNMRAMNRCWQFREELRLLSNRVSRSNGIADNQLSPSKRD